jgi:hypothetical protein
MGCPDDEYDPGIKDIEQLLSNIESIDEFADGIQKVSSFVLTVLNSGKILDWL